MTKAEFKKLVENGPVILDGATGTNLQKAGMPVGVCPEQWILENPDIMIKLQEDYVAAGTDILYAPTFTANRIKLEEYGLADRLEEMNRELIALSQKAAQGKALVAADMTMTGQQLYPIGDLMFEDLVDVYKEQAEVVADAGADLFVVETMMSLQECRAAVIAIREVCDLPIMVSLTYNPDGRTLYGTDPATATVVLQSLGADAIGINCSTGPEDMIEPVEKMAEYATIQILAKPNAGLPELENGVTVYKTGPEEFASCGKKLVEAGASIIGGCCGTTPEHIRALKEAVKDMPVHKPLTQKRRILTSERKLVEITLDGNFMVIGERINPTGKKKLQAELREGSLNMVRQMALDQEENGAAILDVNMGMNGIDEKEMMINTIYEVTSTVDCPLCIDSSHVDIIEAALRIYPGRALINSISMEKEKMDKLLPIAEKYGAMFILLPLSDAGLPNDSEEKHAIIRTVMEQAIKIGMSKEDIIVDGLVATIGANPRAAIECYETFSYCKNELGLPTACGLSNISFGLPNREAVNRTFLTLAMENGLFLPIMNPNIASMTEAVRAYKVLKGIDRSCMQYISSYTGQTSAKPAAATAGAADSSMTLAYAMEHGLKKECGSITAKLLETTEPMEIINNMLIPVLDETGTKFEQGKVFLPQLILTADAAQAAFSVIKETMQQRDQAPVSKGKIVLATVKGDIHDIGKNIVKVLLENYGYTVIDLGKDVPCQAVVDAAIEHQVKLVGLSALMTTTLGSMEETIRLLHEQYPSCQTVVGGAVLTPDYAKQIHATFYAKDAKDTVDVAKQVVG